MGFEFKKKLPNATHRREECSRIRAKYPDRIPVIAERSPSCKDSAIPVLKRSRFLVPSDLTIGQFIYVIRKRMELAAEKGLFIMIGSTMPATSMLMSQAYLEQADPEDGFLYISVTGENTFGM